MKVFITGGTGLIGTRLARALIDRGDTAVVLTRDPEAARGKLPAGVELVAGDPGEAGPWMKAIDGCDAVVNLAGENLFARRWRAAFKQRIRDSRINATVNVVNAIREASAKPAVLVSGSAIGLYGSHDDAEFTEASPAGGDWLAGVCADWEKAAAGAETLGVRVVLLRTGVVLDKEGGALAQMLPPFRWFVGGPVGSGRQWMSWIHWKDQIGLILFALNHADMKGPLNATAPHPVTNKRFSQALGRALHRPAFFKTPGFVLRVMLGEVAHLVTRGQKVMPAKATQAGYAFAFADADAALTDLCG